MQFNSAGDVQFNGDGTTTITTPQPYNNGRWHLASASIGANGMQLYVDGSLVGSIPSFTTAAAVDGYWTIGRYYNTTPYVGSLAGASVIGTQLSATQEAALYRAGASAPNFSAEVTSLAQGAAASSSTPQSLWMLDGNGTPLSSSSTYTFSDPISTTTAFSVNNAGPTNTGTSVQANGPYPLS